MNACIPDKLVSGPLLFRVQTDIELPEIANRFINSIKITYHYATGFGKRVQFRLWFNGQDRGVISMAPSETLTLDFDINITDEDGVLLATKPSKITCELVSVNPSPVSDPRHSAAVETMVHTLNEQRAMNILKAASDTVNNDRQAEYGDPIENAVRAALVATASQGKSITPEDIVQMMSAYKMVRAGRSHKTDNNVDQAGYAEIRERVQKAFRDGTVQKIVEQLLGGWVKFGQEPPQVEATGFIKEINTHQRSNAHLFGGGPRHELVLSVTGGTLTKLGTLCYGEEYALIKKPKE